MKAARSPQAYSKFRQINGSHSYKQAVPGGFVEYQARVRRGGKVFFFNYDLAREMGLIPATHPNRMSAALEQEILTAFSLVIINEYDILHKRKFKPEEILPRTYMATRYLQLQHPDKRGRTSGDGRGIWNGEFRSRGVTWDISSSGTGATCLSPATAIEGEYFRSGDPKVCYGNGYNHLDDGLSTALMSEIFARNGIPTERTLAILEFENGYSINVRASRCLLRPSHFFSPLKQGNYEQLKQAIDYYVERRVQNGDWPRIRDPRKRYEHLARETALAFARSAARFESDYIFCWMDWDGDNILADGGIIDYGSVRQFGLYHHEYRYDDVDRLSTKIPEQKHKARYIVQTFAQIRTFLITGRKQNISRFRRDPVLKLFDHHFAKCLNENLLRKTGFSSEQVDYLMSKHLPLVSKFKKHFSYLEMLISKRGIYDTVDGITCDAIFSMPDGLRELPHRLLKSQGPLEASEFQEVVRSRHARRTDLELSAHRKRRIELFQRTYLDLARLIAGRFRGGKTEKVLLELGMRASLRNPLARITGDGVIWVTEQILKDRRKFDVDEIYQIVSGIVSSQLIDRSQELNGVSPRLKKVIERNLEVILEYRQTI